MPTIKICLSFFPKSLQDLKNYLPSIKDAELIELRLDYFKEIDFREIRSLTKKEVIATIRLQAEGGYWENSSEERILLFQAAIDAGIDYIDVEWISANEILPYLNFYTNTGLILSHHTNEHRLDSLQESFTQMLQSNADVYKLIFHANQIDDNLKALHLIQQAKSKNVQYVIHAMGETGTASRILGALNGNSWTYVSHGEENSTAPGQFTLDTVKNWIFLQEKSVQTKIVGLVGHPVAQSSGWKVHNKLLHKKRNAVSESTNKTEDFIYLNFPAPKFRDFWENWKNVVQGLSITIPHKETVIPYLYQTSQSVELSGVCNTAIKKNEQWWGFNTDFFAIVELLQPHRDKLLEGILIIGTGATARSAIAAAKKLGLSNIFITGRNHERGKLLAELFGAVYLSSDELHGLKQSGIVQTTPVGMYPNSGTMPAGSHLFMKNMVVLDVVYNPRITKFLELAKAKDCITISGEEMFIRQAAKQFELFSGVSVELERVREVWQEI